MARKHWSYDQEKELTAMYLGGSSTSDIACRFKCNQKTIELKIKELKLDRNAGAVIGAHLEAYKRTRRGFHVPKHLEPEYYELLKSGKTIAEAISILKIKKD